MNDKKKLVLYKTSETSELKQLTKPVKKLRCTAYIFLLLFNFWHEYTLHEIIYLSVTPKNKCTVI